MTRVVSSDNKRIAKLAAASFSGQAKVVDYWDQPERSMIPVLSAADSPDEGLISFSTVGLSDHPLPDGVLDPPLGVEICGVSDNEDFAHVLATAAFCVINDQWVAEPGRIFPGVVSLNLPNVSVPNLMFVSAPSLWEGLESKELETKTVAWVLAIPITDAELEYAREAGSAALESMLDESQIDIADHDRSSVI